MMPPRLEKRETWGTSCFQFFDAGDLDHQPSCRKHSGSRRYSRDPEYPYNLQPCALAGMQGAEAPKILLYWSNRPGPNLREEWLQTFAGKLEVGCVRAKSAIDVPMLSSTGVRRTEWISPAWGPPCTNAIPEICPRSLMLLALIMKRLESLEISVLRSVITWFCQMKPWDQLLPESTLFPTTWPRLLMPVAKAATSPGTWPRIVSVPSGCQREAS